MKGKKMEAKELMGDLLEAWRTHDDERRHALVHNVFAESAVHHVAGENLRFSGIDEIEANIAQVNKEQIQGAGFVFGFGNTVTNHDSIQQEWDIADASGNILRTGRDFLIRDDAGKITALYMFGGA
ncbi:MAG TPA: hypothetical protein VGL06_07660 [Pseudonocardiaceae bacterium]|jgi:hypothetical protein